MATKKTAKKKTSGKAVKAKKKATPIKAGKKKKAPAKGKPIAKKVKSTKKANGKPIAKKVKSTPKGKADAKAAPAKKAKATQKVVSAKAKPKRRAKPSSKSSRSGKAASLTAFLKPGSVAVVGASESQGSPGRRVLENLIESSYSGKIFPVAPGKKSILELKAYPAVNKIKDAVDLVILVSRKEATKAHIEQCCKKKVKGVVIMAPKYSGGSENEYVELRKLIVKHQLHVIGPGSIGMISKDSGLYVMQGEQNLAVAAGRSCLVTRSGMLANSLIGGERAADFGISRFIDLGAGFGVNEADCLDYFGKDKGVDIILLALDLFSDPVSLIELGRQVSEKKPVFAIKPSVPVGTSDGAQVSGGGNAIADSLVLEKAGIVQCLDVGEFLDIARSVSKMPLPEGDRVGVVTNSKGLGVMIADSCSSEGLQLAELQPKVKSSLGKALSIRGGASNPVDVPASAGLKGYKAALMSLVKDPTVELILACYIPDGSEDDIAAARLIAKAWTDMKSKRKVPKPVYAVWMSQSDPVGEVTPVGVIEGAGVPVYRLPEDACRVAGSLNRYLALKDVTIGKASRFEVNSAKAERIIARARADKREYLDDGEGQELLNAYGVPTITTVITASLVAARKHAAKIGYPLALKGTSHGLINRFEMKAVALDISTEREMINTYQRIEAHLRKKWNKPFRMMLQPMIDPGLDLTLGAIRHPGYPPVIIFGLGGLFSDAPGVVDFRLGPLSSLEARQMIEESLVFAPMQGGPAQGAINVDKLVEIISRFSMMIENHPEILAADLNPIRAFPGRKFTTIDQFFRLSPK